MPEFTIRIIKQVVVLQKVDERIINVPTLAAAQREAAYILGEEYPLQEDIVAETKENKPETESPF